MLDMATDQRPQRGKGSTRTDQIGTVFIAISQDMRQCLFCEGIFNHQAASEHSTAPCMLGEVRSDLPDLPSVGVDKAISSSQLSSLRCCRFLSCDDYGDFNPAIIPANSLPIDSILALTSLS